MASLNELEMKIKELYGQGMGVGEISRAMSMSAELAEFHIKPFAMGFRSRNEYDTYERMREDYAQTISMLDGGLKITGFGISRVKSNAKGISVIFSEEEGELEKDFVEDVFRKCIWDCMRKVCEHKLMRSPSGRRGIIPQISHFEFNYDGKALTIAPKTVYSRAFLDAYQHVLAREAA